MSAVLEERWGARRYKRVQRQRKERPTDKRTRRAVKESNDEDRQEETRAKSQDRGDKIGAMARRGGVRTEIRKCKKRATEWCGEL